MSRLLFLSLLSACVPLGVTQGGNEGGSLGGPPHSTTSLPTPPSPTASQRPLHPYLKFMVCNGLTNQRQCILEAALLAKELGLGLVLPALVSNGIQDLRKGTKPVLVTDPQEGGGVPFSALFDEPLFTRVMGEQGVPIVPHQAIDVATEFTYPGGAFPARAYKASGRVSVAMGCALFSSVGHTPHLAIKYEAFVEALLGALRPSPPLAAHVATIHAALAGGSPSSSTLSSSTLSSTSSSSSLPSSLPTYDAIHLRYERDWWPLCEYWRAHPDVSPDPANCGLWQPSDLMRLLTTDFAMGGRPLYVAIDEAALDDPDLLPLVRATFPKGMFTRGGILAAAGVPPLSREHGAQVDYHVSLGAHTWVGNSFSTFSGFLVLQRQQERGGLAGTFWYNGGDVPISHFFPIINTLWVFVAGPPIGSSGTTTTLPKEEDPETLSVRAAVLSAVEHGGVDPVCLYAGGVRDELSGWMEGLGVRVVYHSGEDFKGLVEKLLGAAAPNKDARVLPALRKYFAPILTAAAADAGDGGGGQASLLPPHLQPLLKLTLALSLPLSPAIQGFHHAIVTTPYVMFNQRPQTFLLYTRLPACLSMVADRSLVIDRGGLPLHHPYSPNFAFAGLTCLKHRLHVTLSALGEGVVGGLEVVVGAGAATGEAAVAATGVLKDWVAAYGHTLNTAYYGFITPLSPRWNSLPGAPLEPYSIISSGRVGVPPCDLQGTKEEGEGEGEGEGWIHPSIRKQALRLVQLAAKATCGGALGRKALAPYTTKALDWQGSCQGMVEAAVAELGVCGGVEEGSVGGVASDIDSNPAPHVSIQGGGDIPVSATSATGAAGADAAEDGGGVEDLRRRRLVAVNSGTNSGEGGGMGRGEGGARLVGNGARRLNGANSDSPSGSGSPSVTVSPSPTFSISITPLATTMIPSPTVTLSQSFTPLGTTVASTGSATVSLTFSVSPSPVGTTLPPTLSHSLSPLPTSPPSTPTVSQCNTISLTSSPAATTEYFTGTVSRTPPPSSPPSTLSPSPCASGGTPSLTLSPLPTSQPPTPSGKAGPLGPEGGTTTGSESPTPSPYPSSPAPTLTPTLSTSSTPPPSITPTLTPTFTPTLTPSTSSTISTSHSGCVSATHTRSFSASGSLGALASGSAGGGTSTPSLSFSPSNPPSQLSSGSPSVTASHIVPPTPTPTSNGTLSAVGTPTPQPSPSSPPTTTPTLTASPTPTTSPTPTPTPTSSPTPSISRSSSRSPTTTPTLTASPAAIPTLVTPTPTNPTGSNFVLFSLQLPTDSSQATPMVAAFTRAPLLGAALRASMLAILTASGSGVAGVTNVIITNLWGVPVLDSDGVNRITLTFSPLGAGAGYSWTTSEGLTGTVSSSDTSGSPSTTPRTARLLQPRSASASPIPWIKYGVTFKALFASSMNGGGGQAQTALNTIPTLLLNPTRLTQALAPAFTLIAREAGFTTPIGAAYANATLSYGHGTGPANASTESSSIVAAIAIPCVLLLVGMVAFYYWRKRKGKAAPTTLLRSVSIAWENRASKN